MFTHKVLMNQLYPALPMMLVKQVAVNSKRSGDLKDAQERTQDTILSIPAS